MLARDPFPTSGTVQVVVQPQTKAAGVVAVSPRLSDMQGCVAMGVCPRAGVSPKTEPSKEYYSTRDICILTVFRISCAYNKPNNPQNSCERD